MPRILEKFTIKLRGFRPGYNPLGGGDRVRELRAKGYETGERVSPNQGPAIHISFSILRSLEDQAKLPKGTRAKKMVRSTMRRSGLVAMAMARKTGIISKTDNKEKFHPREPHQLTQESEVAKKLLKIIKSGGITGRKLYKNELPPEIFDLLQEELIRADSTILITIPYQRQPREAMKGALITGSDGENHFYLEFDHAKKSISLVFGSIRQNPFAQYSSDGFEVLGTANKKNSERLSAPQILADVTFSDWNSLTFKDLVTHLLQEMGENPNVHRLEKEGMIYGCLEDDIASALDLLFLVASGDRFRGKLTSFHDTMANMHSKDKIIEAASSGNTAPLLMALNYLYDLKPESLERINHRLHEFVRNETPNSYRLTVLERILSEIDQDDVQSEMYRSSKNVYDDLQKNFPMLVRMKELGISPEHLVHFYPQVLAAIIDLFEEIFMSTVNLHTTALKQQNDIITEVTKVVRVFGEDSIAYWNTVGEEIINGINDTVMNAQNNAQEMLRMTRQTRAGYTANEDDFEARRTRLIDTRASDIEIETEGSVQMPGRGTSSLESNQGDNGPPRPEYLPEEEPGSSLYPGKSPLAQHRYSNR